MNCVCTENDNSIYITIGNRCQKTLYIEPQNHQINFHQFWHEFFIIFQSIVSCDNIVCFQHFIDSSIYTIFPRSCFHFFSFHFIALMQVLIVFFCSFIHIRCLCIDIWTMQQYFPIGKFPTEWLFNEDYEYELYACVSWFDKLYWKLLWRVYNIFIFFRCYCFMRVHCACARWKLEPFRRKLFNIENS